MAEQVVQVDERRVLVAPTFTKKERIIFGKPIKAILNSHEADLEYWRWLNGGGDPEQAGDPEYEKELYRRKLACRRRMAYLHMQAQDIRRRAALPQYDHLGKPEERQ